jgi:hypothetical protein
VLATACWLAAAPALPQGGRAGYGRSRWWPEVERNETALGKGRWKRALSRAERLMEQVLHKGWREPDLGRVLGALELQRAIAEANLDRDEQAIWDWQAALNLDPGLDPRRGSGPGGEDSALYGRAEELFSRHPLRRRGEYPDGYAAPDVRPGSDYRPPAAAGEMPTRVLANPAAMEERLTPVDVEVLIDASGHVHQPVVVSSWSHPVLVCFALEALRASPPLRPATLDGTPVAVLETVTMPPPEKLHR